MLLVTDEVLIESYKLAIELKLETEFIQLLLDEIKRRGLHDSFTGFPKLGGGRHEFLYA